MTLADANDSHQYLSGCPTSLHSNMIGKVESQAVPFCAFSEVLYVGGNSNTNASNSVNYGLSYANANNDLTNSNNNIGSRLNFVRINRITVASTLPKKGRTQESIIPRLVTFNVKTWESNKGHDDMRHRLNNCFEMICSMETLEKASEDACRPRSKTLEVALFRQDKENLLRKLQNDIRNHTLVLSDYNMYYKEERGKKRLIADLPLYPDRILHCAIARAIEDRLNRTLIYQTHASIRGHGTHTLMMDFRKQLYHNPKLKYCLSMDVDQFYASIPPSRAKLMLRDYIKDDELLFLMDRIIDNYNRTGYPGIALGGRLSPLIANLYLSDLDHYLKEVRHVHVMGRYMDNIYILGNSKEWLHSIEKDVVARLGDLGLRLNPNTTIQPIDSTHGVDIVGWIVYSDHVLIRKKTKLRMKKGFSRVMEKLDRCEDLDSQDKGMIESYRGGLKWFDSYNLNRKIIRPVMDRIAE